MPERLTQNPSEAAKHQSPKPRDQSRREHLRTLASGALAASVFAENPAQGQENLDLSELKHKRLESDPNFQQFIFEKVKFSENPKLLDEQANNFIKTFIGLQNEIFASMGIKERAAVGMKGEHADINQTGLELARKRMWNLVAGFLGITESYSLTSLNYAIAYQLPKKMAEYGILVKAIANYVLDNEKGQILDVRIPAGFFKVDGLKTRELKIDGENFNFDVISVREMPDMPPQFFAE